MNTPELHLIILNLISVQSRTYLPRVRIELTTFGGIRLIMRLTLCFLL